MGVPKELWLTAARRQAVEDRAGEIGHQHPLLHPRACWLQAAEEGLPERIRLRRPVRRAANRYARKQARRGL